MFPILRGSVAYNLFSLYIIKISQEKIIYFGILRSTIISHFLILF